MPDTAITIRRLTVADTAAFRAIRLDGLTRAPTAFGSTLELGLARTEAWYAARLSQSALFGAFDGADLVGIVGFGVADGPKERHKGKLWSMYVQPEHQGRGIGAALVQAALAHAAGRVEQVQLTVVSDNLPARRLYARLGFTEWGYEKQAHKYQGVYSDEVHMVRFLAPS